MKLALPILLAVTACGDSGPTHWNKQPLETFEGANEGASFTIQLPKGMQKSKVESKYSVEYAYHQDGRVYSPSISVSKASKKKTLDEAIASEYSVKEKGNAVVWKEQTAEGWAFAIENDSYKGREDYLIRAQTGDWDCNGRVSPMTKGGKSKDDIPLVAKMCWSIKTK